MVLVDILPEAYRTFRVEARNQGINFTRLAWQKYFSLVCDDPTDLDAFKAEFPDLPYNAVMEDAVSTYRQAYTGTAPLSKYMDMQYTATLRRKVRAEVVAIQSPLDKKLEGLIPLLDEKANKFIEALEDWVGVEGGVAVRVWLDYLEATCCGTLAAYKEIAPKLANCFDAEMEEELLRYQKIFDDNLPAIDKALGNHYKPGEDFYNYILTRTRGR